jgi:hypothetical protein
MTDEEVRNKARELRLQHAYPVGPEREGPWCRAIDLTPEKLARVYLNLRDKIFRRRARFGGPVWDHMGRLSEFAIWRYGEEQMRGEILAEELRREEARHRPKHAPEQLG